MRLTHATISKFKSVAAHTEAEIEERVTALVGKNEAGKTVALQAIYRMNPIPSGHPVEFEQLRDYPRRYRARDKGSISTAEPISMQFDFEEGDVNAVAQKFGSGALKGTSVSITRHYDDSRRFYGLMANVQGAIRFLVEEAGIDSKFARSTLDLTIDALRSDGADAAEALAHALESMDIEGEIRKIIDKRIPRFQYFDEYNILPGSVSIARLQGVPEDQLKPGERTALSLLRLAAVDQEEFSESEYEPRKAALEAASASLTDELQEYWTQNDDLEIELDIDFRRTPKSAIPEPWLQIRVRNRKHRVTLNMTERSKGFIWFFSFLAAFSEFANDERRVILLDEPGLNLHAKAQNDLLRFIDERLAPAHQVIYSTHSLFMIEPNHLGRCRTVEDSGSEGTVISRDVWAARPETVFPLLAALGVDMTQTLVIGKNQLLVEGPSDVVYLNIMSDLLVRSKRTGLDPRWTITPVGGVDKIPTFIALLGGSSLSVTVLLDVAAGGNQRIANVVERGLLEPQRIVSLTEVTETKEADIEDLFTLEW